jgi:hypothetical protein
MLQIGLSQSVPGSRAYGCDILRRPARQSRSNLEARAMVIDPGLPGVRRAELSLSQRLPFARSGQEKVLGVTRPSK